MAPKRSQNAAKGKAAKPTSAQKATFAAQPKPCAPIAATRGVSVGSKRSATGAGIEPSAKGPIKNLKKSALSAFDDDLSKYFSTTDDDSPSIQTPVNDNRSVNTKLQRGQLPASRLNPRASKRAPAKGVQQAHSSRTQSTRVLYPSLDRTNGGRPSTQVSKAVDKSTKDDTLQEGPNTLLHKLWDRINTSAEFLRIHREGTELAGGSDPKKIPEGVQREAKNHLKSFAHHIDDLSSIIDDLNLDFRTRNSISAHLEELRTGFGEAVGRLPLTKKDSAAAEAYNQDRRYQLELLARDIGYLQRSPVARWPPASLSNGHNRVRRPEWDETLQQAWLNYTAPFYVSPEGQHLRKIYEIGSDFPPDIRKYLQKHVFSRRGRDRVKVGSRTFFAEWEWTLNIKELPLLQATVNLDVWTNEGKSITLNDFDQVAIASLPLQSPKLKSRPVGDRSATKQAIESVLSVQLGSLL